MNSFDTMQWTIIALAVAASTIYAIRKLAPNTVRHSRTRLALKLLQPNSGPTARKLGRWIAPKPQTDSGCGGGSCSGCGDSKPTTRKH